MTARGCSVFFFYHTCPRKRFVLSYNPRQNKILREGIISVYVSIPSS